MHVDLLRLLAVVVVALLGGRLARRIGYPAVLGELLTGIVLGPAVLGLLEGSPTLTLLSDLGVLMMMLAIGMTVDPKELRRASWAGLVVALGGFVGPAALCGGLALWWGESLATATFLGIAAGVTALAVNARILVDLDLMETRLAHLLMAGALVTDVICLLGLAGTLHGGTDAALAAGLRALAFFGVMGGLGLVVLPRLGRPLRRLAAASRPSSLTLALLLALTVAVLAELAGLHGLVGAFFAGMFLREQTIGRELAAQLRRVVHDLSIGFLAPIFFVTTGFLVRFDTLLDDLPALLAFITLATVGKIVGTFVSHVIIGNRWREALVLGLAMNGRGAVEIIVAGVALEAGLIDARLFSMLVVMALVTTAVVPVSLRWGVRWLRAHGELISGRPGRGGVVLIGAGPTALALARALGPGTVTCLVDSAPDHCAEARLAGFDVLQGDALDIDVLDAAGFDHAQTVVAVTSNSTINVLVARLARHEFGVPEVYAASTEDDAALRTAGARLLFGRRVSVEDWDGLLREGRAELGAIETGPQAAAGSSVSLPLAVHTAEGRALHDTTRVPEGSYTLLGLTVAPTAG